MSNLARAKKGFEFSEDDFQAELEAYMRDRAERFSPQIAATLIRDLKEELIAGIRTGERISDLERRVHRLLVDDAADRINKIARTEVPAAFNAGSLTAYKHSGVATHKEWLSARDERVRGDRPGDRFSHIAADGQIVPLDQPFDVGGELLMFPGDPNASAGNRVRCRCTMLPVVGPQAS